MLSRNQRIIESPWTTLGCGALGGFLGTRAMEPVTALLYEHEDEADKRREEELRKEPPFQTLAGRLLELVGVEPSEDRKKKLGMMVHWGYGIGWGVLYAFLRKRVPRLRMALGLPFGILFSIVGDEVMNTVMGLTAPPKAWPIDAHVRGLVGHVTYAAVAEGTCRAVEAACSRA